MKHIEELRSLTVLFADVSGFTALSQELDPEEVREAISLCFEKLNPRIAQHGGTIHKYEGDLVIALFGFPKAHEDDPEQAVKAATEMIGLVPEINRVLGAALGVKRKLGLHIGISSGTVFVGEIGSSDKREYTVMGEIVNLASRLKDTAKNGEILVSESAYRLTRHLFEYETLPPVTVKGIDREVKIYRAGLLRQHPEPKRGIRGLAAPFLGRDLEIYLVQNRLQGLFIGCGGALFITGDAGVGKSRLWSESRRMLAGDSLAMTILESTGLASTADVLFHPFRTYVRQLCGIGETDPPDQVRERLSIRLAELVPVEHDDILPYCAYLFSAHAGSPLDEKIKYLDPRAVRVQVMRSIKTVLMAAAERQPVLTVLDDLQSIDPETQALVEFIFDQPPQVPLLLVGLGRMEKDSPADTARSSLRQALGDNYAEIVLKPLEHGIMDRILTGLLPGADKPDSFRRRILDRAEGNPFYLEEIIRKLIEEGIVYQGSNAPDQGWLISDASERFAIPENIRSVVTSRLDRLDPQARSLLQLASVLGRTFDLKVLERLAGLDPIQFSLHLATLEEGDFIRPGDDQDLGGYHFRHPMIREVVYNSLLKKHRREIHRRAAESLIGISAETPDDQAAAVGYHYADSDRPELALDWLERAGRHALSRLSYAAAIDLFRRIAAIIEEENLDRLQDLAAAYERIGETYNTQGAHDTALPFFEKAAAAARQPFQRARLLAKKAYILHLLGHPLDALTGFDEAAALIIGTSPDEQFEAFSIQMYRCAIHRVTGDMDRAVNECLATLDQLDRSTLAEERKDRLRIRGYNHLGLTYWITGDIESAIDYFNRDIAISEKTGDKRNVSIAMNNLGVVYQMQGEYDKAAAMFERHLGASRSMGNMRSVGIAVANLAETAFYKGEYDRADAYYRDLFKIYEAVGTKIDLGMSYGYLGLMSRDRGDREQARAHLERGRELNEAGGNKLEIATAHSFLGWFYLDQGDLNAADDYLGRAERVFLDIRNKAMLIFTHCLRAELMLRRGETIERPLALTNKAWHLAEELNSGVGRGRVFFTYGRIYRHYRELAKAELNLRMAADVLVKIGQKKTLADAYHELSLVREAQGDRLESRAIREQALKLYREMRLPAPSGPVPSNRDFPH